MGFQPLGTTNKGRKSACGFLVVQRERSYFYVDEMHTPTFSMDRRLGLLYILSTARLLVIHNVNAIPGYFSTMDMLMIPRATL
jgi:hypothetical protein